MKEPRRILIIEDNPGDVLLIREALQATGVEFDVQHCETVPASLQKLRSYQTSSANLPEIILMDYNLPAGTALDVLFAVKENPALSGVKTAVITSSVAPKDREQALEAGANLFVYKPSDFDQFLDSIRTAVLNLLKGPHGSFRKLNETH